MRKWQFPLHSPMSRRSAGRSEALCYVGAENAPGGAFAARWVSGGSQRLGGTVLCVVPLIAACNHIGYTDKCGEFRHKGIERFFATGAISGIQAKHAGRLRLVLGRLNASTSVRDMNLSGLELHELRGSRKGTWAVKASGNWRVTISWAGKDADRVDYEDYH